MKAFVAISVFLVSGFLAANAEYPLQFQDDKKQDSPDDLKKEARQMFMKGKLDSNKKIVEGLSTGDFDKVGKGADEVSALVKGQHWFVIDTKEYQTFSDDMTTAANRLSAAAKVKNIEAAALRYFELTLKCIDCHQYLKTYKY